MILLGGHLNILKDVYDSGCVLGANVCLSAARHGRLEVTHFRTLVHICQHDMNFMRGVLLI